MTLDIIHYKHFHEVEAIGKFLNWQDVHMKVKEDISALRLTGAKGTPVISERGAIVAKGFFELVDWLRKEGHVQL